MAVLPMRFRRTEHFSQKIAEARPVAPVSLLTLANTAGSR
jgi:hypothetical protein